MAKKFRKRKSVKAPKEELSLKEKIPVFIARGSVGVFCLVIIGLIVFTYHLLYRSDYFFINGSQTLWAGESPSAKDYGGFAATGMGQNILKFNARAAADYLMAENPELKSVRILKAFPDRLVIKAEPRVPVAQVGEWSYYLVDGEGVILTEPKESIEENLPVISGAGWRFSQKVGQRDDSARMQNGLSLIKAARESGFTDSHTLAKIDISDQRNVAFFIEDGLEVKIGNGDFTKRLGELERTLETMVVNKDQIKYIDLRFDDVVLGTR